MNAPGVPKVRMTVAQFLEWSQPQPDDRYELVEGRIVAMTRDSVRHNQIKAAAWRAFDDSVRASRLKCIVLVDGVGVTINQRTLRIPDVLVHCGADPAPDALTVDNPVIVVEVVSPSSERDDIETKLIDYFAVASIRHYLIVVSEKRVVLHHERNDRGTIDTRIMHEGDITLDPPGITVTVAALLGPVSRAATGEAT
jgi:Uma2 family endonuclease